MSGNLDSRFRVLATGSAPTSDAPPVTAERLAHEEAPVRAVRGFFFVHSSDTLSWCSRSALGQITAPPKDNSQTWKGRRQRGRRLFIFLEGGDDRHSMRDHDRDHGRTASRDKDNRDNGHRDHRHGHFVNGVWVWYGAPYASNDCSWLRHRALATGSPYWWSRYHECAY